MSAASTTAIAAAAAAAFGVPLPAVLGRCRHHNAVQARRSAMWLSARLTRRSLVEIGETFGRDDRSVRNARWRVEAAIAANPALAGELAEIETAIRSAEEDGSMDDDVTEALALVRETLRDPVAVAKRALRGPRGVTSLSADEIRLLARAVLAAAGEPIQDREGDDDAE